MESTTRSIWILARPRSLAFWFPPLVDTSDGNFHLCHWGVLVANSVAVEYSGTLYRVGEWRNDDMLETLYELKRVGNLNTINVSRHLQRKNLNRGRMAQTSSFKKIGLTQMTILYGVFCGG